MITYILAEGGPSADALKSFVEVVAYIAVTITAVIVAWKHLTGKGNEVKLTPSPVEVREATTFATKPELNAVATRLDGDIHELHGRISSVRKDLTNQIGAFDKRVDEIPQRTIELLKTVKEYHKS